MPDSRPHYSCPMDADARRALWDRIDQHGSRITSLSERLARAEQRDADISARLDRQEQMILRGQALQQEQYAELLASVRRVSEDVRGAEAAQEQKRQDQSALWRRLGVVVSIFALAAALGWVGNEARGDARPPDREVGGVPAIIQESQYRRRNHV